MTTHQFMRPAVVEEVRPKQRGGALEPAPTAPATTTAPAEADDDAPPTDRPLASAAGTPS